MSSQKSKKVKIFKIIVFCIFIILVGILAVKFYPFFRDISTIEGQETFRDELQAMGFAGMLLLASLQFAQIFLVVLPGEPLEILAGMCYGPVGGMFFIFVTVFLTTTVIYFIVKKYKEKYLYNFFEKEKVQKFLNNKWIKNPKKTQILLTILFFIPASPKDLLTYCGALLNIKPLKFILIATFARFPSIISSTLVGSHLVYGDWKSIAIIYGITTIFAVLLLVIYNIVDTKLNERKLKKSQKTEV